jgi:hypothetical protein
MENIPATEIVIRQKFLSRMKRKTVEDPPAYPPAP